jgi:hypothetical protein
MRGDSLDSICVDGRRNYANKNPSASSWGQTAATQPAQTCKQTCSIVELVVTFAFMEAYAAMGFALKFSVTI